jgi:hypothetical protein
MEPVITVCKSGRKSVPIYSSLRNGFWSGVSPFLKTTTGWPIYNNPPIDYENWYYEGLDTYGFSAVPSGFVLYSPEGYPFPIGNSDDLFGGIQAAFWSTTSTLWPTGVTTIHQ